MAGLRFHSRKYCLYRYRQCFVWINPVEKCTQSFNPRCVTTEEKWRHDVFWSFRSQRRLLSSRFPISFPWICSQSTLCISGENIRFPRQPFSFHLYVEDKCGLPNVSPVDNSVQPTANEQVLGGAQNNLPNFLSISITIYLTMQFTRIYIL
jgi:hypothetical protein